ncbi:GTP 3',8-cyclase / cyclic pyranopterin monophosphate synthase [Flavobacteriales bacterium]|nr:MAG: GTP 3',8-cyclase MoaA [Vicingaceae bacterium]CAG0962415.1 GTP 3',8-cyclase / cyclic pyranopterin monophosphate synthase [Flavobacteriales bacterium]
MITDHFGRIHDYLRISLTELCNLRCFYCMPEEGVPLRDKAEFMRHEEILDIASVFVKLGVKKIRLTGGEPLVKGNIENILSGLSKLPVELAITTNGIVADKYINALKDNRIKNINVSLDTLNKEKFLKISRRDYFDKVLNNIRLLIDEGFNVKLNTVLMRNVNDDEIIDFITFSKQHKVHVRFIEFMPFDGNKWSWDKGVSQKEVIEKAEHFFGKHRVLKINDAPNDTARNYQIEGFKGSFAIISSVTNPFCDTCNRIRLTADGKIKNCLFSNSETDLLTPYRNGENIEKYILSSIKNKKQSRGGMNSFEEFISSSTEHKNRSMITIGG